MRREVSRDEAWHLLDHAARRWLSMSADEFVARYDRGEVCSVLPGSKPTLSSS